VDNPFLSVDGSDLSLPRFVHYPRDENFIVLTDRHAGYTMSSLKILGQIGAHQLATGFRVGSKVRLACLAAVRTNIGVVLHDNMV